VLQAKDSFDAVGAMLKFVETLQVLGVAVLLDMPLFPSNKSSVVFVSARYVDDGLWCMDGRYVGGCDAGRGTVKVGSNRVG
jgi:hypothetical protein